MISLAGLPRALSNLRVLVLGDVMIDEYVWGVTDRVSPEAPVPIVGIRGRSHELGGAANAARGASGMGCRVVLAGVVGDDAEGASLGAMCRTAGISGELLMVEGRPTTLKTRIISNSQQLLRIDRETVEPIDESSEERLIALATALISDADTVLISDYAKGAITAQVVREIVFAARLKGLPVVVDPKVLDFSVYRGATVVKPNWREALVAIGDKSGGMASLDDVGWQLVERADGPVLITLGAKGMCLFSADGPPVQIPAVQRQVYDVTGAGDTVASILALALGAGATLVEGAHLAAIAAGIVVGKVGTASMTMTELQDAILSEASADAL